MFEPNNFAVGVINVWNTLPVDRVDFSLLLHLNGLYSRLIYRRFYYITGLGLFLGYYQRHLWPYNPVHTCILNCLSYTCIFPSVRINDDDDDEDDDESLENNALKRCTWRDQTMYQILAKSSNPRLKIWGSPPPLRFHGKWILIIARCPPSTIIPPRYQISASCGDLRISNLWPTSLRGSQNAPACQISRQSGHVWLSYWW